MQPAHRDQIGRYTAAALTSLKVCMDWFGPLSRGSLTLLDPRRGSGSLPEGVDVVLDPAQWVDRPPAMLLELNVARGIARRYVHDVVGSSGLPPWFVDGLAELTARRIAVPLFETRALPGGYAVHEDRYFGGFVPRLINIRLFPETGGEPLPAYRTRPRVDPVAVPEAVEDVRSLTAKTVLTLFTLERWVGRPAFDAIVREFVRRSGGRQASIADFTRTASAVSGQDLSWLLAQAFESPRIFDYAVERLESEPDAGGFYRSAVVVRRLGDGMFTGTSAPRVGPFESGRGVTLRMTLADGSARVDTWDGRALSKTFLYRSRVRAASAQIDPERTLLLDVNLTNNSRALAPRTKAAAARWSALWLLWLENLLLTYAWLV